MDLKQIKNLLNLISESDVNEVYIEEGDFKIKIKKNSDTIQHVAASAPYPVHAQTIELAASTKAPAPAAAPAAGAVPDSVAPKPASNAVSIKSPIVGTYYSAPSPDDKPYVSVGDTVSKGDTLCIIEAMKIMNEINAETGGKITKILVSNGQPVEYDQPLFEIEPA